MLSDGIPGRSLGGTPIPIWHIDMSQRDCLALSWPSSLGLVITLEGMRIHGGKWAHLKYGDPMNGLPSSASRHAAKSGVRRDGASVRVEQGRTWTIGADGRADEDLARLMSDYKVSRVTIGRQRDRGRTQLRILKVLFVVTAAASVALSLLLIFSAASSSETDLALISLGAAVLTTFAYLVPLSAFLRREKRRREELRRLAIVLDILERNDVAMHEHHLRRLAGDRQVPYKRSA